jgi:hypothetical protein
MSRPRSSGGLRDVAMDAGLFAIALALAYLVLRLNMEQPWDLETYWYAAIAAVRGLSPYDTGTLARLAHRPFGMPFLYPPITLLLFFPLTLLHLVAAVRFWFLFKAALLFALFRIWRTRFLPRVHPAALAVAVAFGFNAAVVWDLKAGNVEIPVQLLLWIAFAGFVTGRRRLFAGFVVAAALFKLLPIAFLALLWVPGGDGKRSVRLGLGAAGAWAALVFLPALLGPAWAHGFLGLTGGERPAGTAGPSWIGLIEMLRGGALEPIQSPPYHTLAIWLGYAAALTGASLLALRRAARRGDPTEWVLIAAALYCLLAPRMTAYSYLLAIVPSLALAAPALRRIGGALAVTGLLAAQTVLAPVFWFDYRIPWLANLPFLLLLALWLAFVFVGSGSEPGEPVPPRERALGGARRPRRGAARG